MTFDDSHDDDQQKLGQRWLGNTPLLDIHHPRIRLLAVRLTQLKYGQRAKAQACFEYVRALPFGCIGTGTGQASCIGTSGNAINSSSSSNSYRLGRGSSGKRSSSQSLSSAAAVASSATNRNQRSTWSGVSTAPRQRWQVKGATVSACK